MRAVLLLLLLAPSAAATATEEADSTQCSVGDSYTYTGAGAKCEVHEQNANSFVPTTCGGATPVCFVGQENKRYYNEVSDGTEWGFFMEVGKFDTADCLMVTKTASCVEDAKAECAEWKKKVRTSGSKEYTYECDDGSQPCPDNMINPMSCECGTETSNNNNGCPVTSCRSNCKQIEAAANVVTASLEVAGVKESDLVADKSMQTGIIKGFSTATGVGVSQIAITQIGTTKLNTRRLQDKLAIKFAITSDSPEGAKKLQAMVQSTSAADISNGIKAAGIAGVTATSSPTATVAESVTPVIAVTVTSSGLSDGEKAGIAIGVILGVVALGAAMFLCKPASPSKNEYQNKPVQASQTESSLSGYGQ